MSLLTVYLPALALALVFALPGTADPSTTTGTRTPTTGQAAALTGRPNFQIAYYWYTYPADKYNDHQTLVVEELEWWFVLDAVVDTNPVGGTLIARGYQTNAYPHTAFPLEYLYAHY